MDKCADLTQPTIEAVNFLMDKTNVTITWLSQHLGLHYRTVSSTITKPHTSYSNRVKVHELLYGVYLAVQDCIPEKCL